MQNSSWDVLCNSGSLDFGFSIFEEPAPWSTPLTSRWLLKSVKSCCIKSSRNLINFPMKIGSLIAQWTSSSRSNDEYLSQMTKWMWRPLVLGSQHSCSTPALSQTTLYWWNLLGMFPQSVWRTLPPHRGWWQRWQQTTYQRLKSGHSSYHFLHDSLDGPHLIQHEM